ncbi:MAG: acyl-CoA carboxylase subunit epsilon [Mycobacterium sp.]|nr:acyl-CoA carboxylase subunit epsilon [Mycobacterium sp.]
MSDASENPAEEAAAPATHEPHIKVLKGSPSDAELAALIGVLSAAGGGPAEPVTVEKNLWGHPVDRLRYQSHSWQRVTLLERTHLRK